MSLNRNADDRLQNARNFGNLTDRKRSHRNALDRTDKQDYFRFQLLKSSNFNLLLNRLRANANVQLLNNSGRLISSSQNRGKKPERIQTTLRAGTYFIRVFRRSGNTRYTLRLSASSQIPNSSSSQISNSSKLRRIAPNDFNGDNQTDVIWRNASGKVILWLDKDHTKRVEVDQIGLNYSFEGTGDFNGDGHIDIMWRKNTGEIYAWYMNKTTLVSSVLHGGHDPSATLQGFADLNKDGKTDVIWRLADGTITGWYDRDHTKRSILGKVTSDFTFQGTGDFNADGSADLMWRKDTGEVYVWYMQNTQLLDSAKFSS